MTLAQMIAAAQEQLRTAVAARTQAQNALMALRNDPNLTEDAVNERTAARDAADGEVTRRQEALTALEAEQARENEIADLMNRTQPGAPVPTGGARVTSEPEVYRKSGSTSYFRDLYRAQHMNNRDSVERLARNDRAMADNTEYRALTTTDGAGGDFVPPLWMVQDFVELARAGRVVADQVRQQQLPTGTDSISLPRLATGTAVAEQTTQNTAVQNTDATTGSITAAVTTIAGQQVISQQLLDQSPVNMDEVLLADLAADYAIKLDTFVISNNATNKLGLLSVSGINAVTYTDASPTVGELWAKIADAIQQISTGRLMPPDKGFMHPRRWGWFTAALDTAGRPLIGTNGPQNSIGTNGPNVAQGYLGNFQGIDWYGDPNLPINLGGGTNEDRIVIVRSTDVILYEGTPRSETFRETKADQLSVLLRFYNYAALHASRYPKSISVISGTGLATPTF
jgi:HK97 family phage major capsid protein